MVQMASENSEFVKYVSHSQSRNFECYIFSKEQLMVLHKLKQVTLNVDVTGTVIRSSKKKQEKR
jgi:hypothetical protein